MSCSVADGFSIFVCDKGTVIGGTCCRVVLMLNCSWCNQNNLCVAVLKISELSQVLAVWDSNSVCTVYTYNILVVLPYFNNYSCVFPSPVTVTYQVLYIHNKIQPVVAVGDECGHSTMHVPLNAGFNAVLRRDNYSVHVSCGEYLLILVVQKKTNVGDAFLSGSTELLYISTALWHLATYSDPLFFPSISALQ